MTAYANVDSGVAGLQIGIDNAVVSKTTAEAIGFGFPVVGFKGDARAFKFRIDSAKAVYSADLVTSNSTTFVVNGVAITPVVFATSHVATAGAIVNAIKAIPVSVANPFGVEAIIDPADATNRTILVRTKGVACTVSSVVTLGASQATMTPAYVAGGMLRGVSSFDQLEGGVYAVNNEINIVERGGIMVPVSTAVDEAKAVYLATDGSFAASGTLVPGAVYDGSTTGAGLVAVRLTGPAPLSTITSSF